MIESAVLFAILYGLAINALKDESYKYFNDFLIEKIKIYVNQP
jgi:hypothetical protein